jgi:acyl-CoA reductase-like NAD-dependent aldehyde dehydrogenase
MSGTLVAGAAPIMAAGFRAMNWIDGAWVDSAKRTKSFDPATGEEIGTFADASHADVEAAIQAAVRVFAESDWKDNRHLRAKVLKQSRTGSKRGARTSSRYSRSKTAR